MNTVKAKTTKKVTKAKKPTSRAPKALTPSQRLILIGIDVICEFVASGESLNTWCKKQIKILFKTTFVVCVSLFKEITKELSLLPI